jgi:phosphohistidine phosphatase
MTGDAPVTPQQLALAHHGDAVAADVDPQRPLSALGRLMVDRLAQIAAARGLRPEVVWHSGKLRARQTAEAYWRASNPFAEFRAIRGLQPEDGPWWLRDHLLGENRPVLVVGHMPYLPRALAFLTTGDENGIADFPLHGLVMLERPPDSRVWIERARITAQD